MEIILIKESRRDDVTREWYDYFSGLRIRRYIDGNRQKEYEQEMDFFDCHHTKDKLKELLS